MPLDVCAHIIELLLEQDAGLALGTSAAAAAGAALAVCACRPIQVLLLQRLLNLPLHLCLLLPQPTEFLADLALDGGVEVLLPRESNRDRAARPAVALFRLCLFCRRTP